MTVTRNFVNLFLSVGILANVAFGTDSEEGATTLEKPAKKSCLYTLETQFQREDLENAAIVSAGLASAGGAVGATTAMIGAAGAAGATILTVTPILIASATVIAAPLALIPGYLYYRYMKQSLRKGTLANAIYHPQKEVDSLIQLHTTIRDTHPDATLPQAFQALRSANLLGAVCSEKGKIFSWDDISQIVSKQFTEFLHHTTLSKSPDISYEGTKYGDQKRIMLKAKADLKKLNSKIRKLKRKAFSLGVTGTWNDADKAAKDPIEEEIKTLKAKRQPLEEAIQFYDDNYWIWKDKRNEAYTLWTIEHGTMEAATSMVELKGTHAP